MIAAVTTATEFAGAEGYLALVMSELSPGHRFTVVVGDQAPALARARFEEAGAHVEVVAGLSRRPSLAAAARLLRTLARIDPQVVHANLSDQGDGLVPLLAARLLGRPLVATLHNAIPGRGAAHERLSRCCLRLPHRLIAVSEDGAGYPRAAGAEVVVVRNGIRPSAPALDARAQLGSTADRFLVCGVGRLHHQKAWDVLCRAAPTVRRSCPSADIVVVGEGEERERLRAGPGGTSVRFVGPHPSAASLLHAADVLVLPSRYEAFGLVLVEAMLAEVAVVATAVGAIPEVVGDTAVLVPPEQPARLAGAIVDLARDPERRRLLGRSGRRRALALFGAHRMAEQTAEVYAAVSG